MLPDPGRKALDPKCPRKVTDSLFLGMTSPVGSQLPGRLTCLAKLAGDCSLMSVISAALWMTVWKGVQNE
jgi:hypothetical protein